MATSESGTLAADDLTTQVIDLVRRGVANTRPELVKETGLGRTVVLERVEQAIRQGLLANDDLSQSTGGRPSRTVRFRGEAGTVHAIEVGSKHIAVAVTSLDGQLISSATRDWTLVQGPQATFDTAITMLGELAVDQPWAFGVALPGPVSFADARPVEAGIMMPGWERFDMRTWFSGHSSAPVWADNDLNILVYEEWERNHRNVDDLDRDIILVKVSNGIGAGILSNGLVHRGRQGAAGAIGHTTVQSAETVICRCGQVNCLDAFAGGWALVRDATSAAGRGESPFLSARVAARGELTVADIADGILQADEVCFGLAQRSATLIGETMATLVSFFNPSVVYLGGVLPDVGDLFVTTVRRIVLNNSLPLATRDLRIVHTDTGQQDAVLGAAQLAIRQLFDPANAQLWAR